jgi:hypothetical protein
MDDTGVPPPPPQLTMLTPHPSQRTEPWDYPLFMVVGAWAGYKYVALEESMTARVNERRAALDKPPMQLGGLLDLKKWGAE